MNRVDRQDIHEAGTELREAAYSLRLALKHLAGQTSGPMAAHLMTCAGACEAMADRAAMVADKSWEGF